MNIGYDVSYLLLTALSYMAFPLIMFIFYRKTLANPIPLILVIINGVLVYLLLSNIDYYDPRIQEIRDINPLIFYSTINFFLLILIPTNLISFGNNSTSKIKTLFTVFVFFSVYLFVYVIILKQNIHITDISVVDANGNGSVTIVEAENAGYRMPIRYSNWLYEYMDDRDNDGLVGE